MPVFSPDSSPQGFPGTAPVFSPDSSPQGSPDSAPVFSPDSSPQGSPGTAPVFSPDSSPQGSPETMPVFSPDSSPQGFPGTAPVFSPDSSPQGSPDSAPVFSPDSSPQGSPTAVPTKAPVQAPTKPPTAQCSKKKLNQFVLTINTGGQGNKVRFNVKKSNKEKTKFKVLVFKMKVKKNDENVFKKCISKKECYKATILYGGKADKGIKKYTSTFGGKPLKNSFFQDTKKESFKFGKC